MINYQPYNSKELVDCLARNEEGAFTEIYERFWKKLFAIAYNRLREKEAAEDIVHDVFASLWINRNRIEINCLENYLATATKYITLSKIQKLERARQYNKDTHSTPVFELTIESSLHYKRILERVNSEVEKLPEKCKLIFKYSRDDGMSIKHIAQELNIAPKTVENQINKALKQLRQAVKTFIVLLFILFFVCYFK